MATLFELQSRVDQLKAQLLELTSQNKRGELKPYTPEWERLQQQIRGLESQIVGIENQIAAGNFATEAPQGPASSGQVTQENQNAKVSGAVTQNPATEGRVFRADQVNRNLADTGTNEPTKTTTQTQATPAPNPNSTTPTASQTGGVGARGEDSGTNNTNQTQQLVNNAFKDRIIPQPNVMDQYVNYTYSISWYLLTQDQFNSIAKGGNKNTNEWKLLMQTGGAATNQRDQQFPVDFYLDNLEIQTELALGGTGAAHSGTKIEFTVTEPAGITLIERLYRAVQAIAPDNANYAVQPHCLVIRFYGYDENGKLITPAKGSIAGSPATIVEKFYPMIVTNITFRNANKLVEYRVTAVPTAIYYQTGEVYGSVPYPFELVGETVEQLLVGQPNQANAPAQGRDSQTKPAPPDTDSTTSVDGGIDVSNITVAP